MSSVETIASPSCQVFKGAFGVYDTEFAYYSCKEPPPQYSSGNQWTLYRVAQNGGSPEALASATNAIWPLTKDDGAVYVYFANDVDDVGNTWGQDIKRVAFGSQTLQNFATYWDINNAPILLTQTADAMFFGHGSLITRSPKPEGGDQILTWDAVPSVQAAWTDGSVLGWVSRPQVPPPVPAAYQMPETGGTPQKSLDFPELCVRFFHDATTGGWIALCRPVEGSSVMDVLSFSAAGAVNVIASGVAPYAAWYSWAVYTDRLCWLQDLDTYQVRCADSSGAISNYQLHGYPLTVLGGYLYFSSSSSLKRIPLTATSSP